MRAIPRTAHECDVCRRIGNDCGDVSLVCEHIEAIAEKDGLFNGWFHAAKLDTRTMLVNDRSVNLDNERLIHERSGAVTRSDTHRVCRRRVACRHEERAIAYDIRAWWSVCRWKRCRDTSP